jgi:hypothetical protein
MMESLKWTPLAKRRPEQRLILLFKIVNDLVAIPTDMISSPLTTDQAEFQITDR